ncbi:hypothetical protein [Fenollaria massiliensis]|uniref:hypothetical protein n=1 Tax=Fenollaria massiliensis TaxID=938288 RepID=UPI000379F326|nr:hypothetical protein [Fenollaria massiliensis]
MKKKIVLFLLVLCLLMSFGCTKTKKENKNDIETKNETTEETRISELEEENKKLKDNLASFALSQEEQEEIIKYYRSIFSNMSKRDDEDLKNKVNADVLTPMFSFKERLLNEEEVIPISSLDDKALTIHFTYKNLPISLRHEYQLAFQDELIKIDPEKMLEIKTTHDYDIVNNNAYGLNDAAITIKDVKAGDSISIVLSDELAKLCDYKSGSITINIIE